MRRTAHTPPWSRDLPRPRCAINLGREHRFGSAVVACDPRPVLGAIQAELRFRAGQRYFRSERRLFLSRPLRHRHGQCGGGGRQVTPGIHGADAVVHSLAGHQAKITVRRFAGAAQQCFWSCLKLFRLGPVYIVVVYALRRRPQGARLVSHLPRRLVRLERARVWREVHLVCLSAAPVLGLDHAVQNPGRWSRPRCRSQSQHRMWLSPVCVRRRPAEPYRCPRRPNAMEIPRPGWLPLLSRRSAA